MSITVIRTEPDKKVLKETSCKNCGVGLQYLPIDVQKSTSKDMSGVSEITKFITCPECHSDVIISSW